jgi:membrane-associated protease RseP (regulator of RpoE activity)
MSAIQAISSVNPRLVFLVLLVSTLGYLIYRDREKVQRHSILFYRRTEHGIDLIDRIAKRFPRFWNIYGWTGVIISPLVIILSLLLIKTSFEQMLATGGGTGGPSLIAPGLSGEATFQSGISFIPIEYWIIGIGVLMFVHEMSHGIVARAEEMEINSVGWIVLGIIPGAFVEPKGENMLPEGEEDEEAEEESEEDESDDNEEHEIGLWHQGSLSSQLKVLAAGSFANFVTAAIFALAALGTFMAVAQPVGVFYVAQEEFPAREAGMTNGTIYSMNDKQVRYPGDLIQVSEKVNPGENVTLNTTEGEFTVETVERNGSAHVGILMYGGDGPLAALNDMIYDRREIKPEFENYKSGLSWFISLLEMVALLNLLIGIFNMLPAKPLDGGQMVGAVIDEYAGSLSRYFNAWSLVIWGGLLLSIAFSLTSGLL